MSNDSTRNGSPSYGDGSTRTNDPATHLRASQISDLYHRAAALPAADRCAFLARECRGDDEIRKEVESLLPFESGADGFLKPPAGVAELRPELSDRARFLPGVIVAGRYRVVSLLGRGGMGEVYRADDLKLGQPVALKFLPPQLGDNSELLELLLREARIARQVSHPNICRVYDVGDIDGRYFLNTSTGKISRRCCGASGGCPA